MGNLALFHPELNGVIALLVTGRGPPPEVGTIDSSSEGSWLQGGMEHNEMSKFLCRAQNGESSKLFQSIPPAFLLKQHEWLFHALSSYLFLYGFGSRFQFESGELFPKPVGVEGKVRLRKWSDQLLVNYIASFKPRCKTIGLFISRVRVYISHLSTVFGCKCISISSYIYV